MRYARIQEIREFTKGGRSEEMSAPTPVEDDSQSYEDWLANG